jgi:hypothetical protein
VRRGGPHAHTRGWSAVHADQRTDDRVHGAESVRAIPRVDLFDKGDGGTIVGDNLFY